MQKLRAVYTVGLVLAILASPGYAAIYKYVDDDGNVTFTDKYRRGATKFADDIPSGPNTLSSPRRRGKSSSKASPTSFPKVDTATQHKRDDIRRTLLEEERGKEQKNLSTAKTALSATGKRPPAEQEKLAENVRLHEKNIEMLDKELARIK